MAFSARPADEEAYTDWTTNEINLVIVRPQLATVPNESLALPSAEVLVQSHPALKATARFITMAEVNQTTEGLAALALVRDNPSVEPVQSSASPDHKPSLSVLELTQVENYGAVTPEQPLIIKSNTILQPDKHLLPIGFDGEYFQPLGQVQRRADGIEIILDRLPEPTGGLGRSIKIYLQKVHSEDFSANFSYPRLAAATVDERGQVSYTRDLRQIQQSVLAANRIVLYIHGLIGSTLAMAASAQPARLRPPLTAAPLADRYELILTFDYEIIHTSIEENARQLKEQLAAVGLGRGRDKTLHIVAHSIGGLVARWFIEREGGNQIVHHLVMVGTPNGGLPWATIADWARVMLGIGLNNLATVSWPAQTLSALVQALETVDVALDELHPQSDFLSRLASSPNPSIPYTIIAGNASLIPSVLQAQENGEPSPFVRLWEKLKPQNWLYQPTGLSFFSAPNDLTVSIASAQQTPIHRSPQPTLLEPVACDQLTYFSTEAGLQALAKALDAAHATY